MTPSNHIDRPGDFNNHSKNVSADDRGLIPTNQALLLKLRPAVMGGLNRGLGKSSLSLCQAEKHGTGNNETLYMSNLLPFLCVCVCVCIFFQCARYQQEVATFSLAFKPTKLPILINP